MSRFFAPRRSRRGFAILLVMSLLTITFAVTYMIIRVESATTQLHSNADLDTLARQAAMTGFSAGLGRLNEVQWSGVDTTLSGSISSEQSYSIAYTTGDSDLTSSDSKQPYRVTFIVTGTAVDPANPRISAQHYVRAVVELRPQATPTSPATLTNSAPYTVYQYTQQTFEVQIPGRIEGPVRFLGDLDLCDEYHASSSQRDRYLTDLNAMRSVGMGDHRPLVGPVSMPLSRTSSTVRTRLTSQLGVTAQDIPTTNDSGWSFPGVVTSYRLYPGGKLYYAQALPSTVRNATYQPNPQTNPLGLFYASGNVQVCDNAVILGTIMTSSDVRVCGRPCRIESVELPALQASSEPVRLPAIVAGDDVEIQETANVTIRGAVAAWDNFDIQSGSYDCILDLQGRVICKGFYLRKRSSWPNGNALYNLYWSWFQDQLNSETSTPTTHYPVWLSYFGLNYAPRIVLKPATIPSRQSWLTPSTTLYTRPAENAGLEWTVVTVDDHYQLPTTTGTNGG